MMGRFVKRFLILTLSAASLLFAVLVTGCNNIVENEVESESPASVTEIKTKTTEPETIVTVSGSLNIRGAFPEEIVNQLNHVEENSRHAEPVSASDRSRTAFPSIPETGLTAEIKAVKVSDSSVTYDATSIDWEHRTFTIGVPVGSSEVSYKITADIKYADKVILSGESEDFSISSENPLVDASLTLGAKKTVTGSTNTNGKGNISLEIEIEDDSEISYCKIKIQEGLFYNKNGGPYNVSDGKILITETDVYSYNATVEFKFYSTSDALLYSFTESVSIFDNLTTNTWVKNGNDPWLVTSGTETICRITNAMIEGYKLTEIWVDETRSIDEMEDNYTSESGTFLNPKVSLSSALSMLNNATKDYTIFIKGTLTGSQMIPESLKKTGSGGGYTYAKSLTICGDTGLDNSGLPQDELKVTGTGTVLTIYTNVPVIIKNLKITGGKQSTESGGGIYINNSEANVYLTNGALITGNQAKVGGGAYVAQGNLFVYGSAVIGKRGVLSHAEDAENSFGNKATTSGGGIGVGSGTLWLGYSSENVPAETSGGVIYNLVKGSAETHGGGIDNQNGTINIAAGLVSYNYACCDEDSTHTGRGGGISTARNAYLSGTAVIEENYADLGGGFYITKDTYNGYLEMSGGIIRSNHAVKERPGVADCYGDGGGVAIGNDASFTMSGGIITLNTADRYGGAVANSGTFNISGSAYIPYGVTKADGSVQTGKGQNEVYLSSEKNITITDSLSEHDAGNVIGITPNSYTEGRTVLAVPAGNTEVILADEVGKFTITPDAANPDTPWRINDQGKLTLAPEGFVSVTSTTINGSETWTPSSTVFVSGRSLTIGALYVCDHEVTRGEFKEVMGEDPSTAAAYDKDGNELTGEAVLNNPVGYVNWYAAIAYCNKLSIKEGLDCAYTVSGISDWENLAYSAIPTSSDGTWNAAACDFEANGYRLPTEAEWEWLARGGENYTYAGSNTLDDVAWCSTTTNGTGSRDVKTKPANGYGLYDMSGNVEEWCWDVYDSISSSTGMAGPDSGLLSRVYRGGSYQGNASSGFAVPHRYGTAPDQRLSRVGFRVVRNTQ